MGSTAGKYLKRAWNLLCGSLLVDGILLCLSSYPQINRISISTSFSLEHYYAWLGAAFFVSLTPVMLYRPQFDMATIFTKKNILLIIGLFLGIEFFIASRINSNTFIFPSSAVMLSMIFLGSKLISVALDQKKRKNSSHSRSLILQEQKEKTLLIGLFLTRMFLLIFSIGIYTEILSNNSILALLSLSLILLALYRNRIFQPPIIS